LQRLNLQKLRFNFDTMPYEWYLHDFLALPALE
jgi:hypothetical protein